jgi:hypothetical protein
MRRLYLFMGFIFLLINYINGQTPISAGIKIGFNSSKMITEIANVNEIEDASKNGLLAGVFVRINLSKFYLQPEAYFAKKGGDFQYTNSSNAIFTQQNDFNTIDTPVLIGLKLIDLKVVNLRIMAGPMASLIIGKDIKYQLNGIETSFSGSPTENFKNTNWGIQAGMGIDVLNFTLDVKYEWGINNISDYNDMTAKSKIINVSLGMKFF